MILSSARERPGTKAQTPSFALRLSVSITCNCGWSYKCRNSTNRGSIPVLMTSSMGGLGSKITFLCVICLSNKRQPQYLSIEVFENFGSPTTSFWDLGWSDHWSYLGLFATKARITSLALKTRRSASEGRSYGSTNHNLGRSIRFLHVTFFIRRRLYRTNVEALRELRQRDLCSSREPNCVSVYGKKSGLPVHPVYLYVAGSLPSPFDVAYR